MLSDPELIQTIIVVVVLLMIGWEILKAFVSHLWHTAAEA